MNARWRAPAGLHTASARLPVEGELPSFGGATGWLNSPPLTAADLRGKLIRQPGSVTGHTFEITFLDSGVQAYSFTFG